jgi:hypothetical protein
MAGRQAGEVVVDTALPGFCGPRSAWRVEDAVVNQGEAALAAPTSIYGCVVGNLPFHGDATI